MLSTGMPSLALISRKGTGGSSSRRAINCWQHGGKPMSASRSAACRSAASSSSSAVATCSSEVFSAFGTCLTWCGPRAARRTRAHSRRAVVASQPGSAAGSRTLFQMVNQIQPDVLADVLGVGTTQLVLAADRPDQRGVPPDECIPRLFVAVPGAAHQIGDYGLMAFDRSKGSGGSGRAVAVLALAVIIWFSSCVPGHPPMSAAGPSRYVPRSVASRVFTTRNGPQDYPQEPGFRHSYLVGAALYAERKTRTVRNNGS